jgi:outer membrane protein TolC
LQYVQTQQVQFQAMISLYLAMGGGWQAAVPPSGS